MSGRSCTPSLVKPTSPRASSATNSTTTGTGRWIENVTRFMSCHPSPARAPRRSALAHRTRRRGSCRHPSGSPRRARRRDRVAARPVSTSTRPLRTRAGLDATALDALLVVHDEHVAEAIAHHARSRAAASRRSTSRPRSRRARTCRDARLAGFGRSTYTRPVRVPL